LGIVSAPLSDALVRIISSIAASGGTVVIAANASLLQSTRFIEDLGWTAVPPPSLAYGQFTRRAGLHIMATPTGHWVETLTGLGGTGVQLMLAHVGQSPAQGHPMIPLVQIASGMPGAAGLRPDLDLVLDEQAHGDREIAEQMLQLLCSTASGEYQPRCGAFGNSDFQLTRGLLGVSL
jgi:altronate dehydratase